MYHALPLRPETNLAAVSLKAIASLGRPVLQQQGI